MRKIHFLGIVGSLVFVLVLFLWPKVDPLIGLEARDPTLILEVRDKLMYSPSHLPYTLSEPDLEDGSMGQSKAILEILKNKTDGTFIECGALDGETRSNTLFMERSLGWKGLLIEADPKNFEMLLKKNRRAWAIHACLSGSRVSQVRFKQDFNMGMIDDNQASRQPNRVATYATVLCIPLETMLAALEWQTVDYFSLDVEGHEYAVLKDIPFDRLDIKTLSVEFRHVPEGKEAIKKLMESNGYEVHSEVTHFDDLANDFIFKKKELR